MCKKAQQAECYVSNCSYEVNNQCVSMQCCNDTPDVAKGIAYHDGAFVATWGWGAPGELRRSTDGIHWTSTRAGYPFGGIVYGAGKFVGIAAHTSVSSPDGITWTAAPDAGFGSVRRVAFADYKGGRFIGMTDTQVVVSSDAFQSWHPASVLPPECFGDISTCGDIIYGNGTIVVAQLAGTACRSTDGGDTWTSAPTGAEVLSRGVFADGQFLFWGDHVRFSSPDGKTWTKTATNLRLEGPVARSDAGTFVLADGGGYAQQALYRSTDGITWAQLAPGTFVQSHPFYAVTFGYADASACSP